MQPSKRFPNKFFSWKERNNIPKLATCQTNESTFPVEKSDSCKRTIEFILLIDEYVPQEVATKVSFLIEDSDEINMKDRCENMSFNISSSQANFDIFTPEMLCGPNVEATTVITHQSNAAGFERVIQVAYELNESVLEKDFFVSVEFSNSIQVENFAACCLVYEHDLQYYHEPLFLSEAFITSFACSVWNVGIFSVSFQERDKPGRWKHTFHEVNQPTENSQDIETLGIVTNPNNTQTDLMKGHCWALRSSMSDSDLNYSEKLASIKKRIIGKNKRTVYYLITKDDLKNFFQLPRDEVARELGICVTLLKKICRKNGIKQWPYRRLKNLEARLVTLKQLVQTCGEISSQDDKIKLYHEMRSLIQERLKIFQGDTL